MPNQYCFVYFLQQILRYRSTMVGEECHQEISVRTNLGYHQQGEGWIDCGLPHCVGKMSGQSEYSCGPQQEGNQSAKPST